MTTLKAVPDHQLNLGAIAVQIRKLHERITVTENPLGDAIRAGELLNEVRESMLAEKGAFKNWLAANFDGHYSTASGYMRLYALRDELKDDKGNWKYTGIDPALLAFSSAALSPEAISEMRRLRRNGVQLEEIGRMFGIRKSTVHYHVAATERNRIKRLQRNRRADANRALERERNAAWMDKQKDPLGEAYSLIRKAAQLMDRISTDKDMSYERKRHLLEAMAALYKVEDEIVAASKSVELKKEVK